MIKLGFYGDISLEMDVENEIADFYGRQELIEMLDNAMAESLEDITAERINDGVFSNVKVKVVKQGMTVKTICDDGEG